MRFRNHYRCARCGHEWSDVWSATCDDDCPKCGARHMSPIRSEDITDTEVRRLNDEFRQSLDPAKGRVVLTSGVMALPEDLRAEVLRKVSSFSDFSPDNDPYGEHDFGAVEVRDSKLFWKIDYFDKAMEFGSGDPADSTSTTRVLTVMLAEEY